MLGLKLIYFNKIMGRMAPATQSVTKHNNELNKATYFSLRANKDESMDETNASFE